MTLITGSFQTYEDIVSGNVMLSKRIVDSGRLPLINNSTNRSRKGINNSSEKDVMGQLEYFSSRKLSEMEEEFLFYE